jgi:hypothetical protein
MDAKHTSAEWSCVITAEEPMIYVNDERYRFEARLEMVPGNCGPQRVGKKKALRAELEANARLITAAPDLLSVLQCAFDSLDKSLLEDCFGYEWVEDATAAIAKATGEQP